MNKLFCMALIFTSFSFADLDIGEDFEPGDLVTAEEFNEKFSKLKKVVGEIKDSDLLGSWDCTTYQSAPGGEVGLEFRLEGGGNGQIGDGYFYSTSGTLTFSEIDTDLSLNSPKQWTTNSINILGDSNQLADEGSYTLLLNTIYFYVPAIINPSYLYSVVYDVEFMDINKLLLKKSFSSFGGADRYLILCEKI
jgi:hypothetical protein